MPQVGPGRFLQTIKLRRDADWFATSAENDPLIRIWHSQGILLRLLRHPKGVAATALAVHPRKDTLAAGYSDGSAALWGADGVLIRFVESRPAERLAKTMFSNQAVSNIAFDANGEKLVSAAMNGFIEVRSAAYEMEAALKLAVPATGACFSPVDSNLVLARGYARNAILWRVKEGRTASFPHEDMIVQAKFTESGKHILTISRDGVAKLWSSDGTLVTATRGATHDADITIRGTAIVLKRRKEKKSFDDVWARSDRFSVRYHSKDNTLALADPQGGLREPEAVLRAIELASTAHRRFVVGSTEGFVSVWDIERGLQHRIRAGAGDIGILALSRDGAHLATGGHSRGEPIRVWNERYKQIGEIRHDDQVYHLSFSPTRRNLLATFSDRVSLWTRDGRLLRARRLGQHVGLPAFLPDERVVLAPGGEVGVYAHSLKLTALIGRWGRNVAINAEGSLVASWSREYDNIALFDLSGKRLHELHCRQGGVRSVAFSRSGAYLVSTGGDLACIWSSGGQLLQKVKGVSANAQFTGDDRFIVGLADEGVSLWETKTGRRVANFALGRMKGAAGHSEWIVYTPDGFWDGSAGSGTLVAMVEGLQGFGIDQFALRNNRPDIILERLGSKDKALIAHYKHRYLKRLQKAGFTEAQLSGELHVPEAKIHATKTSGKFADLRFSISDSKYSLRSYNIYMNGVPLFVGGKPTSGRSREITERIELTEGDNRIEVSVLNEKGAESYRALTFASYSGKVTPDLYYIGFGVSKYHNASLNLRYADQDVQDLRDHLQRMEATGRFRKVHARIFTNAEVTPENIRRAKDILKGARVDDVFVLSISGHGMHDRDDTYYFLTHGADPGNLSKTAANFELVEDLLHGIGPRRKLFLMDTCESGEVEKGSTGKVEAGRKAGTKEDGPKLAKGLRARTPRGVLAELVKQKPFLTDRNRYIYNDLFRRSGAVVFSSSQGTEASLEKDEFRRGLFTHAVIGALSGGGDANKDGVVSLEELKAFVIKRVPELSDNSQHPTVDRDNVHARIGFPVVK